MDAGREKATVLAVRKKGISQAASADSSNRRRSWSP